MTTILEQLARGDRSAIARCIDEYGGLVATLSRRYLGVGQADVDDAVQEIFVSIWLSAPRFDPSRGSEPAFIATIAHRRLTDVRRRLSARRAPVDSAPASASRQNGPTADDLARLDAQVGGLPDDERTALWLAISRGLSHSEIAAATGEPIGTIKTRLRRAVHRLQAAWGERDGAGASHAGEGQS